MTVTIDGTKGTTTPGLYSSTTFTGTYTDGLVADYTTGLGRISVGASDGLAFYNGGVATTELMRLDASGNLGVGSTSPLAKLTVQGAQGGELYINYNGTSTNYYNGGTHIFQSATGSAERARIDSSGRLFVGYGASAVGYPAGSVGAVGYIGKKGTSAGLNTSGNCFNMSWNDGLTGAHLWVDTTDLGQITTTSDYRLKENIATQTEDALSKVIRLNPVVFNRKTVEIFEGSEAVEEGFIAHEVQDIIPSAVFGEKDAVTEDGGIQPQSLNLAPIVSVLTKAIQEQQAIIQQLQADVAALKGNA